MVRNAAWRRSLLCVLALSLGLASAPCQARIYTNHWAVRIGGGPDVADRIAEKYGYRNMGQVSSPHQKATFGFVGACVVCQGRGALISPVKRPKFKPDSPRWSDFVVSGFPVSRRRRRKKQKKAFPKQIFSTRMAQQVPAVGRSSPRPHGPPARGSQNRLEKVPLLVLQGLWSEDGPLPAGEPCLLTGQQQNCSPTPGFCCETKLAAKI